MKELGARDSGLGARLWETRELSTVAILVVEIAFFTWYLWPGDGRSHPFLNAANGLLILKYSSIYGIAAIGASMVIIAGGVDLSPGAVIESVIYAPSGVALVFVTPFVTTNSGQCAGPPLA